MFLAFPFIFRSNEVHEVGVGEGSCSHVAEMSQMAKLIPIAL